MLQSMGSQRTGRDLATEQIISMSQKEKPNYHTNCCCFSVAKYCLILLGPHQLEPARLLCPWDFSGKKIRVVVSFSRGFIDVDKCLTISTPIHDFKKPQ